MAQARRLFLYLLPLALFVGLTVLLYSGIGKDPTLLNSTMIGKALPEFSKPRLMQIKTLITEKDLQGPALINVFGSWCPACYHEHPYLMNLAATNEITIYGLNYKDQIEPALEFVEEQGNPYDLIIFDENGRLGIDLGVYGAPETFVINKDNRIVYRHVGVLSPQILKDKIMPALLIQEPATLNQTDKPAEEK